MTNGWKAGLTLAALSMALTGCGAVGTVRIGRLLSDPYHYQNRRVNIEGTVTNSVNAVVAGAYQIDDGTGRIYVISSGGSPQRGSHVRVNGRVQNGVSILGQSFGTTVRERDRHTDYRRGGPAYRSNRP